jgi:Holliday junction DNA helicase RuvA
MIEYLNGHIAGKSPAHVVLDLHGTGYWVNISLNTYVALADSEQVKLFIHEVIRDDAHILYGFANHDERELFRMLVSVSGVGASTGILFLSSLRPDEIRNAIVSGDIDRLKSIKGVGLKTAQRIVGELKDKLSRNLFCPIFFDGKQYRAKRSVICIGNLGF